MLTVATRLSGATGAEVFREVARAAADLVRAEMSMVGLSRIEGGETFVETLAAYFDGRLIKNFTYPLAGTPCEGVVGRYFGYIRAGAQDQFDDPNLVTLGVEGYAAFPLVRPDGRSLGLLVTMSRGPIENPRRVESLLRILAERVVAEIERAQAGEALRVAEASYRAIFDAGEDPVFVHDWNTMKVLDVNAKACDVYGFTREEFRQIRIVEISSGEAPYSARDAVRWIEAAKRDGLAQFEWHRKNKDGSLHWDEVRLKSTVIEGHPRILAFTREITERKRAEAVLRASEAMYRAIFDASVDGLGLVKPSGEMVDLNAAMATITGFPREEMAGRNALDFLPPENRVDGQQFLDAVFTKGYAQAEQRTRRKDGKELRFEPRGVPVVYRGEPHVLLILRDITDARAPAGAGAQRRAAARDGGGGIGLHRDHGQCGSHIGVESGRRTLFRLPHERGIGPILRRAVLPAQPARAVSRPPSSAPDAPPA